MSDPRVEEFGQVLRRLRSAAGLSQEQLAERAGLSVRGISDLERGRRRIPHPATIRRLTEALEIDGDARAELGRAARPARLPKSSAGQMPALSTIPRNPLPLPAAPLFGREREVVDIGAMLTRPDVRLVTLAGPGGAGKTRLALEVAARLNGGSQRTVVFVPLAPLADPDLVIPTIAEALGARESGDAPLLSRLRTHIGDVDILLVLDNAEHLLAASPAIGELLATCPGLTVLVTSRAALHLRLEYLIEVVPLGLPQPGTDVHAADVERYSALALFVDRVRMTQPAFRVSDANITVITSICQRLDGLPLALELAAARIRVLSPQELLALLDRRLPILTGGARDLPERHQTLRDTISWSYDLLSDEARRTFRSLSICSGGWTLSAAAHLAGDASLVLPELVDQLEILLDHHLVQRVDHSDRPTRYDMLETIREFAAEQLADDELEAVGARHAAYFAQLVERQGFDRIIAEEALRLARVDAELDNVRAALRWYLERRDIVMSLTLAASLRQYWVVRGHLTEGRRWLTAALALEDNAPSSARAEALRAAGSLAINQGDLDEAERLAAECLTLNHELQNEGGTAGALHLLALAAQLRDDYARAVALYEQSLTLKRRLRHPTLSVTLGNLAQVAYHQGDTDRAIALFDECIVLNRETEDDTQLGVAMTDLGLIMLERGDDRRAEELFYEALQIHREIGFWRMITTTLEGIAALAGKAHQPERAARLYGAEEALSEKIGHRRQDPERWQYARFVADARAQLPPETFQAAWAAGRALSLDEALVYALSPPAE